MIKEKRAGAALPFRTFEGSDGKTYLVFKIGAQFHVFAEVEAKQAARACGATFESNTQTMWRDVWDGRV